MTAYCPDLGKWFLQDGVQEMELHSWITYTL